MEAVQPKEVLARFILGAGLEVLAGRGLFDARRESGDAVEDQLVQVGGLVHFVDD